MTPERPAGSVLLLLVKWAARRLKDFLHILHRREEDAQLHRACTNVGDGMIKTAVE